MLRLPARKFQGWRHYFEVEPFGETRADWRAASIRSMVHNTNVKEKYQLPVEKFLLKFEEKPGGSTPGSGTKQTWQQQKSLMLQGLKAAQGRAKKVRND